MTRQIKINISEITETFDVYSLAAAEKAKIIKAQADALKKADAKITRLRADNEKLREETRSKGERIGGYVNMLVKREAEIEKLRAALVFYADDDNWRLNGPLDANSGNFTGGPAKEIVER